MGSKCHQNNSPVVCDGYVKYEEVEVDRLVAILKTNNCGGGGPCGIQKAARLGEGCLITVICPVLTHAHMDLVINRLIIHYCIISIH